VLNDFDSDIEFSEMGLSDKEEIDSDDDTVLADIAKWSDPAGAGRTPMTI
jgi:hypothetical protein